MLRSLVVAFSTYSKIPMPHFDWEEKDMRYSMVFFPIIGIVIGMLEFALLFCSNLIDVSHVFEAILLTLIPLWITGGIHFDGFLDVSDARSSYGTTEKKLEILKDPHIGAFAVIHGICYTLLQVALWFEILEKGNDDVFVMVIGIFIFSRVLSGLSVVSFQKAKKDGMLSTMADAQNKKVLGILVAELVFFLVLFDCFYVLETAFVFISMFLVFIYYYYMSKKHFGGITGDLAGWFLQMAELVGSLGLLLYLYASIYFHI